MTRSWLDDEALALSGMRNASTGDLERPLRPQRGWYSPTRVWRSGGCLRWTWDPPRQPRRIVEWSPELLPAFIDTSDGSDLAIERFAKKWSVLLVSERDICRHPIPTSHKRAARSHIEPALGSGESWLPLDAWRHIAGKVRASVHIAARLHIGQQPDLEDWAQLLPTEGILQARQSEEFRDLERALLARQVSDWLRRGTGVTLSWQGRGGPGMSIEPDDMFGAVALQAASVIARAGLAVCSGCAEPFIPHMRRAPDRDWYCARCGREAARRAASKRWRDKKKGEGT